MKKILLIACAIVLFVTQNAYSDSELVVNGLPMVKAMSDIEGIESENLSKDEQFKYKLLITKQGNKYIWASRDNRELLLRQNGVFYDFIEAGGAGYIRVSISERTVLYMEHLKLGFKTITYWGTSRDFNIE